MRCRMPASCVVFPWRGAMRRLRLRHLVVVLPCQGKWVARWTGTAPSGSPRIRTGTVRGLNPLPLPVGLETRTRPDDLHAPGCGKAESP